MHWGILLPYKSATHRVTQNSVGEGEVLVWLSFNNIRKTRFRNNVLACSLVWKVSGTALRCVPPHKYPCLHMKGQLDSTCWQNAKWKISQTIKQLQTTWIMERKITWKDTFGHFRPEWVKKWAVFIKRSHSLKATWRPNNINSSIVKSMTGVPSWKDGSWSAVKKYPCYL
jgi:hypothetical protein